MITPRRGPLLSDGGAPSTQGVPPSELVFPSDFLWGTATAAFQVEGATHEDGRTDSIWDTFCRIPGAVAGGDNGDVACDHYHRWPEDLDLLVDLGVNVYRFSTALPRIIPAPGVVEQRGLDFYSRLVDGLLDRGILPWISLYHWDLPQWLEDKGGWASRDVVGHLADFATTVHGALGDRVRHWATLNEPWCSAYFGYGGGQHAPGRQDPQAAVSATHHLLLAHGEMTRALRSADPTATIGLTVNCTVTDPAHAEHPDDVAAAELSESLNHWVFIEPVIRGRYPEPAVEAFASAGTHLPVRDGDLDVIATPIDFLGINYYSGGAVCTRPSAAEVRTPNESAVLRPTSTPNVGLGEVYNVSRGLPRTAMDWEIQPDGLRRVLERLQAEYTGPTGIPLYVTENGSAHDDVVGPDGQVDDRERCEFLTSHLEALHRAIRAGVDVRGYFVWSLLDNFEWAFGYGKRFGMVRVDFDTLERTPKRSAKVFAQVATTGRLPAGDMVKA
jgi:beta-glucosidase